MAWTSAAIPDQRGKTFVVTGANSGIGLEAAAVLAEKGAHVVLACRSPSRAKDALESITKRSVAASVEVMSLDLSSLRSVRAFASELVETHSRRRRSRRSRSPVTLATRPRRSSTRDPRWRARARRAC